MLGRFWGYLKETVADFWADDALSRGAAISFYTILSLGPILVICIAIAGFAFGEEAARGSIMGQLEGLMGKESAALVQSMIASAGQHEKGVWATIIGIITLLITATSVFAELQYDLNYIWRAQPQSTTVTGLLKARAASLGLVATFGFLLLISLVISAGLNAAGEYLHTRMPAVQTGLQVANFILSFIIISAMFAAIYKILPDRNLTWRDVGVGAIVTALLLTIGKTVIGIYIGRAGIASSYGAAGTLIVILLWIYYSCQIFLLGAEFTKVWAAHHGSKEAFEAKMESDPVRAAAMAPSPVQKVIAETAQHRTRITWFDIAALGAIVLATMKAREGRTRWF